MLASLRSRLLATTVAATLMGAPAAVAKAIHPPAETGEVRDAAEVGDGSGAVVEELLVTARRQSEKAQEVPIALSAVSGEALERKGTYTLEDIQHQIPSFTALNSNPRNSSVGIRGIGVSTAADGLDTSVGFYFDGVYLGRPGMALADLVDIDSFEVLRGPQGTLFGRNSSAGVVNITTRKPSFTPQATIEASIGNYSYNQLRASLTGPLIDGLLAFRLTAFNTDRDGVLDNTTTGVKANSVSRSGARLQFLITPSPELSLRLIGEYSKEDDTCCVSVLTGVIPAAVGGAGAARALAAFSALGYRPTANLHASQNNSPQDMRTDQKAFSGEVDWNLGWADLTSITAWRYWHFDPLQDSDGTPLDIIQVNVARTRDTQLSQEFRLASKPGRFTWQAGVYLFQQKLKDHYILNQFGADASAYYTALVRAANPSAAAISIAPGSQYLGDTSTTSKAAAVFGQANYQLTDQLTLTAGIRFTHDERSGVSKTSTTGTPYAATSIPFAYDVGVKGDNTSWLASAAYRLTPDNLVYASYSTGYKSAGLNLNAAVSAGSPLVVQPEDTTNWEIGSKNEFLGHTLVLNLAAFWTELSGLQANIALPGLRSYLANVGDVRSRGVEADANWNVTRNLTVSVNGGFVDAVYTSYPNAPCAVGRTAPCDLSGRPLFLSPKWTANATARYEFEAGDRIRPYAQLQYAYRSTQQGTVQDDPLTLIPAYSLVNARVGARLDDGRYDVSLWVDNLTDETYYQSIGAASIVGASAYGVSARLGTPRTFGATLRATF